MKPRRWKLLIGLALLCGAALGALALPAVRQVAMATLPTTWKIALSAWRHGVQVDHQITIDMPDGKRLRASLYRPRDADGRLPTVLIRVPYHRLRYGEGYNSALFFAKNGYAVVVEDLRGTGDSEGELLPWRDVAGDGVATLDWIGRQAWSTGKVGTFGCSALGETQFVLAKENHASHAAMIASGAGGAVGTAAGRYAYFGVFEGGIFELASGFGWFAESGMGHRSASGDPPVDYARFLRDLPVSGLERKVRSRSSAYNDFLSTPLGDRRWEDWGYLSNADFSDIPALVINTWGDQSLGDTLALAENWRQRSVRQAQKVVIAPGDHCQHEEAGVETDRFGILPIPNAARPWRQWYLRWFDHWLRGQPDDFSDLQAYNYFMLVDNRWYGSDRWPPAEAHSERWHLGSGGRANARTGNGTLTPSPAVLAASDSFRYDPANPVPSRGGPVCCTGNPLDKAGPADQKDVETRDDVLVYTSAPLAADLRIAGPLHAHLTVSSDAPDTDFVVRLVHVWPDGLATGIQEGALRLRYRDGFIQPKLATPGQRYQLSVDMRSIAYMVPRGHRLRLHVTSSSFPRLARNLNTGASNNTDESRAVIALNRVFHGPDANSFVELPVLRAPP